MDEKDLKNLNDNIKHTHSILGVKKKHCLNSELKSKKFARRSLVLNRDVRKNSIIKSKYIICKRPGTGISPVELSKAIGRKVIKNLKEDHILRWSDFKK